MFFFGNEDESTTFTVPPIKLNPDITMSVQILSGLVNGLNLENNLTSLPVCEQAVQNFTALIEAAGELLKNDTSSSITQAIILMSHSFGYLKTANTNCDETYKQIQAYFQEVVMELSNHMADADAIVTMIKNFPTTSVDIQTIITYYNEQDWYKFGQATGDFMTYVLATVAKDQTGFLEEIVV